MKVSRWVLGFTALSLLAIPVVSQTALRPVAELEQWASGPDGEAVFSVSSVKLRKQGNKLQFWAYDRWNDTNAGEVRRVALLHETDYDENLILGADELKTWLASAKPGTAVAGRSGGSVWVFEVAPDGKVLLTSSGFSTRELDRAVVEKRLTEEADLKACRSNLKNTATALEMYCVDYEGRYPKTLSLLTPNYLRVLPDCPAAGKDTLSASYELGVNPDAYTIFCQGNHHKSMAVPPNYPQYTSVQGLIEHP